MRPMPLVMERRFDYVLAEQRRCQLAFGSPECGATGGECGRSAETCVSAGGKRNYTPDPPADQVVFELRTLTYTERVECTRIIQERRPEVDALDYILRCGALVGWRNLKDGDGNLVTFAATAEGYPTPATLARIPLQSWGAELAREIWTRSNLEDAARKN